MVYKEVVEEVKGRDTDWKKKYLSIYIYGSTALCWTLAAYSVS
jgi:hypothetical protein